MTTTEAIKQLLTEHDLIASERELDGSQFAPALLEALAMAISTLETQDRQAIIAGNYLLEGEDNVPDTNVGDMISRQAAIDTEGLDVQIRCEMCRNPMHTDRGCDGNCKYDEKLYERIMQILDERIKPLPSAQSTMGQVFDGDTVSRQAAIDAAKDWYDGLICGSFRGLEKRLKSLQSAQPERNKGKWITQEFGSWAECSECHELYDIPIACSNFCPHCGVDMRGEQE